MYKSKVSIAKFDHLSRGQDHNPNKPKSRNAKISTRNGNKPKSQEDKIPTQPKSRHRRNFDEQKSRNFKFPTTINSRILPQ